MQLLLHDSRALLLVSVRDAGSRQMRPRKMCVSKSQPTTPTPMLRSRVCQNPDMNIDLNH